MRNVGMTMHGVKGIKVEQRRMRSEVLGPYDVVDITIMPEAGKPSSFESLEIAAYLEDGCSVDDPGFWDVAGAKGLGQGELKADAAKDLNPMFHDLQDYVSKRAWADVGVALGMIIKEQGLSLDRDDFEAFYEAFYAEV